MGSPRRALAQGARSSPRRCGKPRAIRLGEHWGWPIRVLSPEVSYELDVSSLSVLHHQ